MKCLTKLTSGWQLVSARYLGVASLATVERPAFLPEQPTSGTVDGAVNASAAEQRAVGRVDDGVNFQLGDVAAKQADLV